MHLEAQVDLTEAALAMEVEVALKLPRIERNATYILRSGTTISHSSKLMRVRKLSRAFPQQIALQEPLRG